MAGPCCVCSHPAADSIHAALRDHSVPVTALARTHELSRDSLNFCRRRHLDIALTSPSLLPTPQSAAVKHTGTGNRARERFLSVYAECGNISTAAAAAGVNRSAVYKWQEHDDTFVAAMKQAESHATELLEKEAWRRARDGFAEPVYQHGKLVGTVQRYSDALLVFLLKARAPERYRDRVDVSVTPVIKAVAGFEPADVV